MASSLRGAARAVARAGTIMPILARTHTHTHTLTHTVAVGASRRCFAAAAAGVSVEEFQAASKAVQSLPSVTNEDKLKLYALFKQATAGPNTTSKPGMFDIVAKMKWQAWTDLGKMSQEEARAAYVSYCKSLGAPVGGGAASTSGASTATASSTHAAAPAATAVPSSTEIVKVEQAGPVRTITLNRPEKRNAITIAMYKELIAQLEAAGKDASTSVTVVTGAGAFFSSGNDLSNFTENMPKEGPAKMAEQGKEILHAFVNAFIQHPKVLVVGLNGPAVGIAVTTLPLADFVYASHKATLHAPLTALGQCPEGTSSVTFPRVMGQARANELLLAGRKLTADEAKEWGLVNEVFEEGSFREELGKRVAIFAALPPQAMMASKALLRDPIRAELEAANARECAVIKERWLSDECMTAIMRFMSSKKK